MYKITIKILGERLKQIREHLKITQKQLAERINHNQAAISNLELGKGGSITLLVTLLNFYSQYVYIDLIFSEKFYLISSEDNEDANKSMFNSVIVEIIKQATSHFEDDIDTVKEKFKAEIEKAIGLLTN